MHLTSTLYKIYFTWWWSRSVAIFVLDFSSDYSLNDFPVLLTLCSLKFCNLSIHIKNPFLLCNLFDPHRRIQRFGKWRGGGVQLMKINTINYNIRVKAKQKKYWNICNAPTCETRQVHVYFFFARFNFKCIFGKK